MMQNYKFHIKGGCALSMNRGINPMNGVNKSLTGNPGFRGYL
jgi:hypothetical protein